MDRDESYPYSEAMPLDLTPLIVGHDGRAPPDEIATRTALTTVWPSYLMLIPDPSFLQLAIEDRSHATSFLQPAIKDRSHATKLASFSLRVRSSYTFSSHQICDIHVCGYDMRFPSPLPLWKALALHSWEDEDTVNRAVEFVWSRHGCLFYEDRDIFAKLWARADRRGIYRALQRVAKDYMRTMSTMLEMGAKSPGSPLTLLTQPDRRQIVMLLLSMT